MSEKIVPLTTEHLRILREENHTLRVVVENGFEDMRKRLNRVEQQNAGLKRDEAEAATELSDHQIHLDEIPARLRRLEEKIEQV